MFYLTTHSTHFSYGYIASDILWLRTILIVRKETHCRHIGYSFRLAAMVLLYAPSHRQDSTYHGLCYTSREALAETRNSSMGPPHEGSIRRPIAPWANALTTELHLAPGPHTGHLPVTQSVYCASALTVPGILLPCRSAHQHPCPLVLHALMLAALFSTHWHCSRSNSPSLVHRGTYGLFERNAPIRSFWHGVFSISVKRFCF